MIATWLRVTLVLAAVVGVCWLTFGEHSGGFWLVCAAAVISEGYLSRQLVREWRDDLLELREVFEHHEPLLHALRQPQRPRVPRRDLAELDAAVLLAALPLHKPPDVQQHEREALGVCRASARIARVHPV